MPRPFKFSILTANDLFSGEVVYFSTAPSAHWDNKLHNAYVFFEEEEAQAALKNTKENQVVGAYLVEVQIENGAPVTSHFREDFRATGPSNYYHGKQADVSL